MDGVEITREEYEALAADIALTFEYADKVYRGEMTIADVPERLRENVQEQVDMLIADVGPFDPDEITDEEALAIIRGASV